MNRRKPRVGDVIQIELPSGRFAYGRVLRDASIAIYRETTDQAGQPPVGDRDFQFTVGVYEDVLTSAKCPVVGHDPSQDPDEDWPPPNAVKDPISGDFSVYHKGIIRPATEAEAGDLETAAVWDLNHIVDRITGRVKWL